MEAPAQIEEDGGFGSGGTPGTGGLTGAGTGGTVGTGGAVGSGGRGGSGGATGGVGGKGGSAGTGGTSATGGTPGTGGVTATGGVKGTGGITATGGVTGTGGVTATGGVKGTGGVTATGGITGTGGVTATGGITGTGGVTATGGVTGTGGVTATGGITGTGGVTATGGVTGTGGVTATGGVTGTGGVTATGGVVGSGGKGGTGGGMAGGGGSGGGGGGNVRPLGGVLDCSSAGALALTPDGQVADFSPAVWNSSTGKWCDADGLSGSVFSYAGTSSTSAAAVDTTAQNLKLNLKVGAADYAGGGLTFDSCVNASGFTSVQFNATITAGSLTGCVWQVQLQTQDQRASTATSPSGGTCASNCYRFPTVTTLATPTATATTYTELFTAFNNPASSTIPTRTQVVGIQWQVNSGSAGTGTCTVELRIDNIKFQ
jgi:hypothetical protein